MIFGGSWWLLVGDIGGIGEVGWNLGGWVEFGRLGGIWEVGWTWGTQIGECTSRTQV